MDQEGNNIYLGTGATVCIYNHFASSWDPFAKKNNEKNHGGTNLANGKAPEESNMKDQKNFSHIWVQPEAHMLEKGTHFNTMRATARRWYKSQMRKHQVQRCSE
ncbi:hypothetical protein V6N13_082389 [Hibiscus sabdariffa]|uniref:Uncharacterized protein n=1 Tax=Hibiscus sabdariffa TaxID=183260 RepID=A0ABR2Q3E7_9ROSI